MPAINATLDHYPLLYVAIGRRLGYPLHVAMSKEHFFVRWEGDGERFNIEATSYGFTPRTDEDYRVLPRPLSPVDIANWPYLQNFPPRINLAHFLAERGTCLLYNLRISAAFWAFEHAMRLARNMPGVFAGWRTCSVVLAAIHYAEVDALRAGQRTIDLRTLRPARPRGAPPLEKNPPEFDRLQEILRVTSADPVIRIPVLPTRPMNGEIP